MKKETILAYNLFRVVFIPLGIEFLILSLYNNAFNAMFDLRVFLTTIVVVSGLMALYAYDFCRKYKKDLKNEEEDSTHEL